MIESNDPISTPDSSVKQQYKNDNESAKSVEKQKPKDIFSGMTKIEAEEAGLIDVFNRVDQRGNNNGIIDKVEFAKYQNFLVQTQVVTKLTQHEKNTLQTQVKEKDLSTYLRDKYGLDISQFQSKEELIKAIKETRDDAYAKKEKSYTDSLIKGGIPGDQFLSQYIKTFKIHGKMTAQQIEDCAKAKTEHDKLLEEANLALNIKSPESKELFLAVAFSADSSKDKDVSETDNTEKTNKNSNADATKRHNIQLFTFLLSSMKPEDKGKLLKALNISTANVDLSKLDPKTMRTIADQIYKSNIKITDICDAINNGNITLGADGETAFTRRGAQDLNDKKKYSNEKDRVDNTNALSESVIKSQNTAKNAKILMETVSKDLAPTVVQNLASHVYDIKDEQQRNQVLSTLQSSKYYNDDVENAINVSYQNKIKAENENKSSNTSSTSVSVGSTADKTTTPALNISHLTANDKQQSDQNTTAQIKTGENKQSETYANEIEVSKKTNDAIKLADATGVTKNVKDERVQLAVSSINNYFKKDVQSKASLNKIITTLSAATPPLLCNIFVNGNPKVQKFMFEEKLISPAILVGYMKSDDIKAFPETIKNTIITFQLNNNLKTIDEIEQKGITISDPIRAMNKNLELKPEAVA